jgi:hypothetical protein
MAIAEDAFASDMGEHRWRYRLKALHTDDAGQVCLLGSVDLELRFAVG